MKRVLNRPSAPWTERLTDAYLLAMLTVFPLYTGFQGYAALTEAKLGCFLVLTLGYFALLVLIPLVLLLVGKRVFPERGALRKAITPTRVLIAVFLLMNVLSALLSPNRALTWLGTGRYEGLMTALLYGGVFLALSFFAVPKLWHAYAAAGTVTAISVLSILQYLGLNPLGLYPEGTTYHDAFRRYSGAFLGTIGNVDLLSAFLCLAVPFLLVGALVLKKPLFLIPAGLGLAVLLLSGVSAGRVGLGLGGFLLAPLVFHKHKRPVAALSLAILVGALLLVYFWPGPPSGTLYELSRVLHGEVSDHFGSSRIAIWKNCLNLVPERILLGGGPGTLARRLQMTFQREVQPGLVLRAAVDMAHNEYLDLLVNVGVLGLGTYLAALASTLVRWRKRAAESGVSLMLAAAMVCYLIQAFFSFSLCITAPFFWITWGLLDAVSLQKHSKKEVKRP